MNDKPLLLWMTKPAMAAGLSGVEFECESALLALLGEFFSAFFSMNENVIRISEVLFPLLPDFAEAAPVLKFDCFKGLKEFLVAFGLQLLHKTRKELAGF